MQKRYKIAATRCKFCQGLVTWDVKIDGKFPTHLDSQGYIQGDGRCPTFKKQDQIVPTAPIKIEKRDLGLESYIFTEVFPINSNAIPPLYAYQLTIKGQDANLIGGKLAYRCQKEFAGHWVWAADRLVTDQRRTKEELLKVLEKLWHEQPEPFQSLRDIELDSAWRSTPQSTAIFVSNGLFADVEPAIRKLLHNKAVNIGGAVVEHIHETRGWVIQGHPAVSLSISSRLIYKEDLKIYASRIPSPDDLIHLWVGDKTSSMKGEIIEIAGELRDHRRRLLAFVPREDMQDLITEAPNDELVVTVLAGRNRYDYPISALRIILRFEDFSRFGIDSQQVFKHIHIDPQRRSDLVYEIAALATKRHWIGDLYTSKDAPNFFKKGTDLPIPRLRIGSNKVIPYDERSLLGQLRQWGLYRLSAKFQKGIPIDIGVINALGSSPITEFCAQLQQELRQMKVESRLLSIETVEVSSRVDLEKVIQKILPKKPHIILAFLPGEEDEEEESWGIYHHFKSLTIGQGIASQVVNQSTLTKPFAVPNTVLGMLGKTGNIPFALAEPLPYADLIVGIDIARERKVRLPGSINATAIARIYFSNGEFIRYVIHDAPLEGETIPDDVLQSLFPSREFTGKRVIIHRDGYFRGNEQRALQSWAQKIGATFHLVEVIKSGAPRIYKLENDKVVRPEKGSSFILNDREALIISSLPPFLNATPQPLHIRTDGSLSLDQTLDSILSLTILHYGSLRPPRLPVTIHYSDRIAYLALRGIKPKELEGLIPFWL